MGEAGGTEQLPWRHPKARFFGAPPRFFAQEQRNGVDRAVGAKTHLPRKRRTRTSPQTPTSPRPKSGEDESRLLRQKRSRGWWSHQGKKSAFLWRLDTVSLGKHQRNGVERQDKPTTTSQRNGAHVQTQKKAKGGTPGEGSPLDPLLRLNKHKRVPRSAERGQGRCPWTLPPLKRWTKLSNALRAAVRRRRRRRL